jgi:hypothetical protein
MVIWFTMWYLSDRHGVYIIMWWGNMRHMVYIQWWHQMNYDIYIYDIISMTSDSRDSSGDLVHFAIFLRNMRVFIKGLFHRKSKTIQLMGYHHLWQAPCWQIKAQVHATLPVVPFGQNERFLSNGWPAIGGRFSGIESIGHWPSQEPIHWR